MKWELSQTWVKVQAKKIEKLIIGVNAQSGVTLASQFRAPSGQFERACTGHTIVLI